MSPLISVVITSLSDLNYDFLFGCSERKHVLMDEPYTVGNFSPENYDKKFRGQVRFGFCIYNSVPRTFMCR